MRSGGWSFAVVGFVCLLALAAASMVRAGVIQVPAGQATITAGIVAAAPGDTVLVEDPTYQSAN